MKYPTRLLSLLILVSAAVFFANCGGDDSPGKSAQEKAYEALKGTWTLSSATLGTSDDWTDEYSGATLNLTANSFSENASFSYAFSRAGGVSPSAWPGTGKWKFGTNPSTQAVRLDSEKGFTDVNVTYVVTASALTIEFTLPADHSFDIAGRKSSVQGDWTFEFTK